MSYKTWFVIGNLFFVAFVVNAQHDTLAIQPKDFFPEDTIGRVWWGLEAGIERCDRTISTTDRYYTSRTNFTNVSKRIPGVGFHIGANLYYNYNDKWKLETGLQYLSNNYTIEKYKLPFLSRSASTGNDSIILKDIKFDYYQAFVYVPLHLKYRLMEKGKLDFYATMGGGLMVLLFDADRNSYQDMFTKYEITYNPVTLNWYGGLTVFYQVAPDIKLKLEPACRGTITSAIKRPDGGTYFNALISVGLVYTRK